MKPVSRRVRLQGLLGLTAIEAHGLELQRAFLVITSHHKSSHQVQRQMQRFRLIPIQIHSPSPIYYNQW